MEEILKLEGQPLSDNDLRRMLGKDSSRVKVIMYDDLKKFESLEQLLPNKMQAVIILLQIEGPNAPAVGHWIALLNHGDHFEHFDSYGLTPDQELHLTHEDKYLTKLIQNTQMRLESNRHQLQAKREHVNTCGRYCVVRVKYPQYEKDQFVEFIRKVHHTPDVAVTMMTQFL